MADVSSEVLGKTSIRKSLDTEDFINLLHGSDPVKVELNGLENEVRDKDGELGEAQAEIRALRLSERAREKAVEETYTMEVSRVLHMKGGDGKRSYAKNSSFQNMILSQTKAIKRAAAVEFYCKFFPDIVKIADLGCSSGPNSLVAFSDIIESIRQKCSLLGRHFPDFMLLLNDLPKNDFNHIFSLLPDFNNKWGFNDQGKYNCARSYIYGVSGSFYGRLFPSNSLDIVHSSMSLHWLSQVPNLEDGFNRLLNIGNVYISKTSELRVRDAYLMQFEKDLSFFLTCRSEEMVAGGRMILTVVGRNGDPALVENCCEWELLAQALRDMAAEGLVDPGEIDSFNVPYYAASVEEIRSIVTKVGSFDIDILDKQETIFEETKKDQCDGDHHSNNDVDVAELMSRTMRAVLEPMLASHFGEDKMEELFKRYHNQFEEYCSMNRVVGIYIIMSLVKKS